MQIEKDIIDDAVLPEQELKYGTDSTMELI